jgi:hypothetical protein
MTQENRLDKVEKSLTPKQTVIHWLQEIKDYRNCTEYINFLRSQPESAAPVTRLTRQIDQVVREAMRGCPKMTIEEGVRRAVKDVVFLLKLHLQVNYKIMSNLRPWRLAQLGLSECLGKLHTEFLLRNLIADIADRVNFQTPYPLDPETAASVDVAIRNHVYTWEALIEEGIIRDWLWEYLISQGAKELPLIASRYKDGKNEPNVTPENEAEIRACFPNETQFQLFHSGQDYTCDLASVTDAEYCRHYDTIVNTLKELVKSGQVQKGTIVCLETIPIPFLRGVPLIKGEWLDSYSVELAEWGALLQAQGYRLQDDQQTPLLTPVPIIGKDGKISDSDEIKILRLKVTRNLAKFPGRILKINQHLFLNFKDYCNWRGRKVKGDLRKQVKEGLVTPSWNKWCNGHGGEGLATVAGVKVHDLHCYVNECSYYSCPGNVEEHFRQREQLLESIRIWGFKPDSKENLIKEWKEAVGYCLVELYAFYQAVAFIQKSYFEGQAVLFPDVAKELADITTEAETTVSNFNNGFPDPKEPFSPIDLETLRQNAGKQTGQIIAYIVDMAKVEALDCMGDEKTARELAQQYI